MIKYRTVVKNIIFKTLMLGLSVSCLVLYSATVFANCNGVTPKCSEVAKTESQGGCVPNGSKSHFSNNSSEQVKAKCVANQTSNGCYNSVPVSNVGSYNRAGWRASKNRNHFGSDLGTGGDPRVIAYAPADGVIKGCTLSGGGGRTMVIEHTKHCDGAGKSGSYYTTVFRHFFKPERCSGSVKKGDRLGIVGGSNYVRSANLLCDAEKQGGGKKCKKISKDKKVCCSPYPIHLHMEVVDGRVNASATSVASNMTYQASCGGLQALCGGCPVSTKSCRGGMQGYSNGQRATADDAQRPDAMGENPNGDEMGDDSGEPACLLSNYLDAEGCTSCDIFKTIFNAASTIAATAIGNLAAPSRTLVLTGFLIWLAIYVLKQISSFQGASPGDMLKGIIFQGARVAIVVFMLSGALYQVMDLTLNPVMKTGLTFANSLNPNSNCDTSREYMQGINGYGSDTGLQSTSIGGLSRDLGESIICTIKNLEDSVGILMSLGNYSICLSFHDRSVLDGLMPHLGYLISGAGLWLVGLFLLFAFPWCLIDCILQLCIAAAMMPCAVAAFAFKSTAKYIKIVWEFFMNAMFNLVFMAVLLFILTSMFKNWIGLSNESLASFDPNLLVTAFQEDGLAWWGIGFFKIFAFVFLFVCFIDEVPQMAQNFASGAPMGGSKGIGRMVGGTVAQTAAAGLKGAGHIAAKSAGAIGEATNSLAGNWARSKWNQAKGITLMALGGRKITDADGKTIGYQARFKVPGFTQTRTVTKDANGVWSQTKETHQKTAADKEFKPMVNANGEQTYAVKTGGKGPFSEYEEMTKSVDSASGNNVYTSKDGQSMLITDANGNILQYKRRRDTSMRQEEHRGSVQNINDAFMHKRTMVDAKGNVIGTDVEFKNVSSKYLVNKDGSTNMHAYNQIMNGVSDENKADALAAMAGIHMASRGQTLDNRFKSRDVVMDNNGGITITQTNRDGSVQLVNAQMVGGQMVISNQITDTKGNVTIQKTNGLQNKTTSFSKQKDGTYKKSVKYSFTDEAHSRSRLSDPLDANGAWGYGINPQKAMSGFNANEFQEHLDQLANGKIKDTSLTEVQMLMETNNKQLPKLADSQRGATILHGLASVQSQTPDTQQKNIDANTYLQQFNMSTPPNYNASGHSLPKSRFDKNGVKHTVKYAQNGDYSDTFKQKDGSRQTLIYGKDNKVKAKIVIDKNNNETRIMYKNDGTDVFKNNSSGGITRQSFDKDKNLLSEVVQNKDGRSSLNNASGAVHTSSPTRAELLDVSAALQEDIANGVVDSQEQMMAQELIKQELQSIIDDPTQLSQMKDNELKETVMLADAAVKDADGRRDADLDKLLNDAMAVMTPQQKAELMLTANLSKELAAQLVS